MCLYPRLIPNPKYKITKKNGGNIPAVFDERLKSVPIGCGNCMECMKKKTREWQIRILEEIRHDNRGKFVTLTFSNEEYIKLAKERPKFSGYFLENQIATLAVRRFLECWRKEFKKSVKHWLVTELGHNGTQRIHLHGIIWTDNILSIEKHWKYGYVWKGQEKNDTLINYVNEKTATYITKYVSKKDEIHKEYKPIILTSPGIGKGYINRLDSKQNKYNGEDTKEYYRTRTGHRISLPIYWRNQLYTEKEREKLWLNKLDKQKRYIMGEEINIKNGITTYLNTLKHYQEINVEMGYGTDEKNWELKQYENELRRLKQQEIINNNNKKNNKKNNNNKDEITT